MEILLSVENYNIFVVFFSECCSLCRFLHSAYKSTDGTGLSLI